MQLNKLPKSVSRNAKRLGRGLGSGRGKTAGRGTKGQKSRSGHNIPRRFEGGQMPLIQRLPKTRGFGSLKSKDQIVKISEIEKEFKPGDLVSPKTLSEKGLAQKALPIKIVADKNSEMKFQFRGVRLNKKLLKKYLSNRIATAKPSKKVPKKNTVTTAK